MPENLSRIEHHLLGEGTMEQMYANYAIIHRNYFLQVFEVHNPGSNVGVIGGCFPCD
ncbi:hypothetical protein DBT_1507 [Dissulfuribacter thermophilus]|uniref:Uncharacterized protein n=2 Tax=Dissulfuribacter thermophilus TaxID=1156395 RepID=A0A1B9F5I0_9BACT|nr:hypothetical protein DBT_1507 [Dissulfuribacter thermophilus]